MDCYHIRCLGIAGWLFASHANQPATAVHTFNSLPDCPRTHLIIATQPDTDRHCNRPLNPNPIPCAMDELTRC